ncbi:MAG TPA: hypothetical protein VGM56_16145 [Byssovorax sp.]|jgi:hypothetical protein
MHRHFASLLVLAPLAVAGLLTGCMGSADSEDANEPGSMAQGVGPVADVALRATPDGGLVACDLDTQELVVIDASLEATSSRSVAACPFAVGADGALFESGARGLVKETTAGAPIWTQAVPRTANLLVGVVDPGGDVYALVQANAAEVEFAGAQLALGTYVVKLDPQGTLLWTHAARSDATMLAASDGGVAVLGRRVQDGSTAPITVDGATVDAPGYASVLSSDGDVVSVVSLGTAGSFNDDSWIAGDADGFVTLIAQSHSTVQDHMTEISTAGSEIVRWTWSGERVWSHSFNGGDVLDFVSDGRGTISLGVIGAHFDGVGASVPDHMVIGSYDATGALTGLDDVGSANDLFQPEGDVVVGPNFVSFARVTDGRLIVPMFASAASMPTDILGDVVLRSFE